MVFYPLIFLLFFRRVHVEGSTFPPNHSSSTTTYCLQPFVPENAHVIFNEPGPYASDTVAKYSDLVSTVCLQFQAKDQKTVNF
uniref:Secreted protein n=2 Tax=Caenorhabditis japonica TaxID=281687 RepID=A0A8R1IJT7_CAEJA